MTSRAVSSMVVDVLVDAGITHVFGLPGGNTMEFWAALHGREHEVRPIVPRDEQTASCMADFYGKYTGRPGVFCAQGVFAGSTGLFGVIEAHLSHSPMLVLSEMSEVDRFIFHGPMQGATGSYGSIDLPAIFGGATKFVAVAHHPREAVTGTQLAIKHALAGCPGPAAVLWRSNALKAEIPEGIYPRIEDTRPLIAASPSRPGDGAIEAACDTLLAARRLVIVAGNGVRLAAATPALRELAELLGAPCGDEPTWARARSRRRTRWPSGPWATPARRWPTRPWRRPMRCSSSGAGSSPRTPVSATRSSSTRGARP
jgi:acetolactate synthase-1/2/3 large subunit